MVRTDLIRLLASEWPDLPPGDVDKVVAAFFDAFTVRLAHGGRVEIRGFGTFTTRLREARTGRDPRTGAPVELSDRRVPWFKASKDLCELINGANPTVPGKKGQADNAATET